MAPSGVELYLLNFGVCHSNELLLSGEFQRRFQYFYYSLFTLCLLAMCVLYALIYCSVLARRARRHRQKTASLAAMTSTFRPATVFDLQPDNCEEMTMTALKVPADISSRCVLDIWTVPSSAKNVYAPSRSAIVTAQAVTYAPYKFSN